MTTYYIDPDAAGGGNGLTEATAFDSWGDATFADNNTYLMKRGTEENLTASLNIVNCDNAYFGNFGTGKLPIVRKYETSSSTGAWSDLGGDIWEFDTGITGTSTQQVVILGIQTLGAWTRKRDTQNHTGLGAESFSVAGEWDSIAGDGAAVTSKLRIYSTGGNPVTVWGNIYWSDIRTPAMRFRSLAGSICDGIRFENSWVGVQVVCWDSGISSNTIVRNCEFHQCYTAIRVFSDLDGIIDGAQVHHNSISDSGKHGIYLQEVQIAQPMINVRIYNNTVIRTGYSVSVGGIYISKTTGGVGSENIIHNNLVLGFNSGYYWSTDGAGIFIDNGGKNYIIHSNIVKNATSANAVGIKVNSGLAGTQLIYNNVVDNVNEGFRHGDVLRDDLADMELYNNIFTGCLTYGVRFNEVEASSHTVKNNIISGTNVASSKGMTITATFTGTLDETYNKLSGFVDNDVNFTVDATDILTVPNVGTDYKTTFANDGYRAGVYVVGFHDTHNNNGDSWGDKVSIGLDDNGYSERKYKENKRNRRR